MSAGMSTIEAHAKIEISSRTLIFKYYRTVISLFRRTKFEVHTV
jgi:hypothetical protein